MSRQTARTFGTLRSNLSSNSAAMIPETSAALLDPIPFPQGMRFTWWYFRGGGAENPMYAYAISTPRHTKFSSGSRSSPPGTRSPSMVMLVFPSPACSSVTSFQRSNAIPRLSNPGPIFADVAGARTVTLFGGHFPLFGSSALQTASFTVRGFTIPGASSAAPTTVARLVSGENLNKLKLGSLETGVTVARVLLLRPPMECGVEELSILVVSSKATSFD
mmetsp:Transcript_27335/g.68931  ORF Transcript_27335/g.68931 Transcript_27335/m.68931 type:complete len:219 (-) Transcript_27335:217-873(-)